MIKVRIKFVLKSEHVLAYKGAWRPTPTQSTCLYYCDVMKLVSVYKGTRIDLK